MRTSYGWQANLRGRQARCTSYGWQANLRGRHDARATVGEPTFFGWIDESRAQVEQMCGGYAELGAVRVYPPKRRVSAGCEARRRE